MGPIILYLALALLFHLYGSSRGFFYLESKKNLPRMETYPLFSFFSIYLISLYLLPTINYIILINTWISLAKVPDPILMLLLQFISCLESIVLMMMFSMTQKKIMIKSVWSFHRGTFLSTFSTDVLYAIGTWIISLPLIVAIHQICELINIHLFHTPGQEQLVVQYLKYVLKKPFWMPFSIITIVIIIPIIEEFIFRGCLLTWLKNRIGFAAALLCSSFLFAIFHFAPGQGIGNFPLLISLFIFSLYLGFIYEKRQSLLPAIALHMLFNGASIIRLLCSS